MSEKHNKGSAALEQLRREALGAWRRVLADLSATGGLGKPDQSEICRIERMIRGADRGELRRVLAFLGTFRARAGEIRPVPCDQLENALTELARRALRGAAGVVDASGGVLDMHSPAVDAQVAKIIASKVDRFRLEAWRSDPDDWLRISEWLATLRPVIRVDLVGGAPIVGVGLVGAAPVKTH